MDAIPPTLPPWQLPELAPPPPPPAPREPAWSGLELTLIVIFTLAAMVVVSLIAVFTWAIAARASGGLMGLPHEQMLVALMLIGQTGGFVLGFGFAWLWVAQAHVRKFWEAIHWRQLSAQGVGYSLLGGAVLMVVVELLGHWVRMPKNSPEQALFTPHTAWLLAIYGVVIAPFFEEFFFRGLLYPTLKATFTSGMEREELHSWQPLVRVLAALAALAVVVWALRVHEFLGTGIGIERPVLLAVLVLILIVPQWPIRAVGWILNQIARLNRGEMLAILVTGFLFGLMHAAQLGWAWGAVLLLALVGVVLTAVRAASDSLIPSWLMHATYNGVVFVAEFVTTQGFHHFPH
ncbi:MAG: CPBP family glutamic-type intramembrane protease [Terriglobales bacterium]